MRVYIFFLLLSAIIVVPQSAAADFSDVPTSHPNFDAIFYVQSKGIVNGYPDGTYRANQMINRAEFTKILVNTITPSEKIQGCLDQHSIPFPDVAKDTWYAKYICAAYNDWIIRGYPDGYFRPARTITFVEAAKILVKSYLGHEEENTVWYKPYVLRMEQWKSIPLTIGSFDHMLSRGEMAEMIYRIDANVRSKPTQTYEQLDSNLRRSSQ